jgi:hypothetical protein
MVSIPSIVQKTFAGVGTLARQAHLPSRQNRRVRAAVRTFVVTIAMFAMCAVAPVQAADDTSPVVGAFPDTEDGLKVYLFLLKKNNISLEMDPEEFCNTMHYGHAVKGERPKEVGKDDKVTPGKLEWVICRFIPKFTAKPEPK